MLHPPAIVVSAMRVGHRFLPGKLSGKQRKEKKDDEKGDGLKYFY